MSFDQIAGITESASSRFDRLANLNEGSKGLRRQERILRAKEKKEKPDPDADRDFSASHLHKFQDANSRLAAQDAPGWDRHYRPGARRNKQGSEGDHYPRPKDAEALKKSHKDARLRVTRTAMKTGELPKGWKMVFGKPRKVGPTDSTRDYSRNSYKD